MAGRVRQTQKLQAGLLELLQTTPFEQITVKAICAVAKVHRSTFYRHYVDKYALLQATCVALYKRCIRAHQTSSLVESFFEMLIANRKLFRNISVNNANPFTFLFLEQIVAAELLQNVTTPTTAQRMPDAMRQAFARSQDAKLTATFFAGALIGVSIDWVNSNFAMPKEQIIANYLNCLR